MQVVLLVGLAMIEMLSQLREELRDQRDAIRASHDRKLAGPQVCTKLATLTDSMVQRLFDATLAQMPSNQADRLLSSVALVGLGSYARRQCSPYSDVDLMILHKHRKSEEIAALLRPLTQGIFDIGLQLGHSVRTPAEAVQLARADAVVGTSLIDARFLLGNQELFETFRDQFSTTIRRNGKSMCRSFLDARRVERDQYGETLYLLEPHVKRSRGGIRDLNLLRWLSFAEHGISDPDRLHLAGAMSKFDFHRLQSAREFLLRIRNEMHFHAGTSHDLLNRAEQLRLAEWIGHTQRSGLLPVEHFMRDYFRHSNHIWQMVRRRIASLQVVSRVTRVLDPVLARKIDEDYRVGLRYVSASPAGLAKLKEDLGEVVRVVALSAREGKFIDHMTWSTLVLAAPDFSTEVSDTVRRQFYDLLAEHRTIGDVLRVLHELGYLEKIVPAMKHVRCLLQFNQYHKFTVDEHSLRAVRKATEFADRTDSLGKAYHAVQDKRVLHLALLLHDLGKGFEEDHSEVGRRIAEETCALFKLDEDTTADVALLVHKHLVMSHLTFRRNTSDPQLIASFAEEIGSTERLRMLFVLTCADLAAVGPGVLNDWKIDLLADVYERSVQTLEHGTKATPETRIESQREAVFSALSASERDDAWFVSQNAALPASFLAARPVDEVIATLRRFYEIADREVDVWCEYIAETKTLEFTAGISQGSGRGGFSSMAGTLSSLGMQIHSAGTDLLADGLLMLRYSVTDPTSPDGTSAARQQEVCRALVASIDSDEPPKFPAVWGEEQAEASMQLSALPNDVRIDTQLSDDFTIVEVFTFDRRGLLYKIARKLHDLKLVISHAKIGTYLDQVVDVFYVTDRARAKVVDQDRLDELREELLEVIRLKDRLPLNP
ncbi:MAG: [protein-PII] uridylyltransferase [Planctomycetota bacterium]